MIDRIVRQNRERAGDNEPTLLFNYAKAIDAGEEGVAVLLNMPEEF